MSISPFIIEFYNDWNTFTTNRTYSPVISNDEQSGWKDINISCANGSKTTIISANPDGISFNHYTSGTADGTYTIPASLSNDLSALFRNRKILIVNPNVSSEFTTINAAITYARNNGVTKTNRFLIFVAPGTYNEALHLHGNPGIDMIGYGATVVNSTSTYPLAALFTTDTGTFIGLTFKSTTNNTYGCHIEKTDNTTNDNGDIRLIDYNFYGKNFAGLGIGLARGQKLYIENCKCFCETANETAAFYMHNCQSENAGTYETQYVYINNCYFDGDTSNSTTNPTDLVINDACKFGGFNTTSIMKMYITNCTSRHQRARFGLTQSIGYESYIHDNANLVLDCISNNDFPALNPNFPYTYYGDFAVTSGSSGSVFLTMPVKAEQMNIQSISRTDSTTTGTTAISPSNAIYKVGTNLGIVSAAPVANCYGTITITSVPF